MGRKGFQPLRLDSPNSCLSALSQKTWYGDWLCKCTSWVVLGKSLCLPPSTAPFVSLCLLYNRVSTQSFTQPTVLFSMCSTLMKHLFPFTVYLKLNSVFKIFCPPRSAIQRSHSSSACLLPIKALEAERKLEARDLSLSGY